MTTDCILMAEKTGKEVVYTAQCLETFTAGDGTQLLIEVTKLSPEELNAVLGDIHDVIKYVDASLDIAKGCLLIGSFVFPAAAPVLVALAGVGSFVQFMMGLIPDHRPDPVVEKLKELQKTIHMLFITESEFTVDIIHETSVLMRLLQNCLKYQNEECLETFRAAYEQNSPLGLAYIMASLLEHKSTNPLVMAMDADRNEVTFDKWDAIFCSVLGELLFIEGIASGLLKEKDAYDWNRLVEQSEEIQRLLIDWRVEYGMKDYWSDLKKYLEDNKSGYTKENKERTASDVKEKLESFETNDSFYVFAFNSGTWNRTYAHLPRDDQTQKYGVWNDEVCVIVYRSRKAFYLTDSDFENSEKTLDECKKRSFHYNGDLKNDIKEQFLDTGLIRKDAFICLINDDYEPIIRYTNCKKFGRSPGSYGSITMMDKLNGGKTMNMTLIIVLP